MVKEIHIAAGLLSILAGAVALAAPKGAPLHRSAGRVFVLAMLGMTLSAMYAAAFVKLNPGNVMAAGLTAYLVFTAVLAVAPPLPRGRLVLGGLMLAALALSALQLDRALEALATPTRTLNGIPGAMMLFFAGVLALAAAMDARLLWVGRLEGAARLTRHLWRMGMAMFIATGSFFLGQPRWFPEWLRQRIDLRAVPVLLVILTVLYWLVRVRLKRKMSLPVDAALRPGPPDLRNLSTEPRSR